MANIKIDNLPPVGSELFHDSESYLNELSEIDTLAVHGGCGDAVSYLSNFEPFLEYVIGAFVNLVAMDYIYKLASKFNVSHY